jgi:hypothetical protein
MGAAADFGADEASLFTEFSPPLCLCIRLERARRPCGRVLNKSVRDAMVVHKFRFSERGEKRLLMANTRAECKRHNGRDQYIENVFDSCLRHVESRRSFPDQTRAYIRVEATSNPFHSSCVLCAIQ